MAALKLIISLLLVALATQAQLAQSQNCVDDLNSLNVCGPYVVPGLPSPNPSPECCNAMRAVDQGCFCNTMRIVSSLPSQCNMSPLTYP